MTNNTKTATSYQQLIAKCWSDVNFKKRLMADPGGILEREGIRVPEGVNVVVVENTKKTITLVIPEPPDELSDEALTFVAGGVEETIIDPGFEGYWLGCGPGLGMT